MRTGRPQKGQFGVQPGMSFVMKDLDDMLPGGSGYGAGRHPWLVTRVDDNYVEMVMCATMSADSEGKHRMSRLLDRNDVYDIVHPCPPMDPSNRRMSYMSMDTFKVFPKKELFSHNLRLLNNSTPERNFATEGVQSLSLGQKEMKILRKELRQYSMNIPEFQMDPFGYLEAENCLYDLQDGESVPEGFSEESFEAQFGWTDIKGANPLDAYPNEDTMTEYERQDRALVAKVRYRDNRLELTEEDLKLLDIDPIKK